MKTIKNLNSFASKAPKSILRAWSSIANTEWGPERKNSVTRLAPACMCSVGSCMRQQPEMQNSVCKDAKSPQIKGMGKNMGSLEKHIWNSK